MKFIFEEEFIIPVMYAQLNEMSEISLVISRYVFPEAASFEKIQQKAVQLFFSLFVRKVLLLNTRRRQKNVRLVFALPSIY